jgi:SAM-dependent methyltransferase
VTTDAIGAVPPINWVARWRNLVLARHDQGRRLDRQHERGDAWSGRARRFAQHVDSGTTADPLLDRLLASVGPNTTILDVGAGPGRHTLPLAARAGQVIAVEPSAAMREVLQERATALGVTNLTIVAAEWPMPRPPSADIVICSHVLYPTVEVEPFVRALDAAAAAEVHIVMRLGQREQPYLGLFERVWGEPRCLAPTALDLFNVVHALGFPAGFTVVPFPDWRAFATREDAADQARQDVLNPVGPEVEAAVADFVAEHVIERDGILGLAAENARAGIVSWTKAGR